MDYYTELCEVMPLPADIAPQVLEFAKATMEALESEWSSDLTVELCSEGLMLSVDAMFCEDDLAILIRRIQLEFDLDDPMVVSWANICSRSIPDGFGGGAMVIQRGYPVQYMDAREWANDIVRKRGEHEAHNESP